MRKLLKNDAAAAAIGISPNTLKTWRGLGKGPKFIKLGASKRAGVVYDPADIEAWKEERKFQSTSAATVNHPGEVTHNG
ncbi:MAG: helix-turn-helix transcriptional regulator [Erythrobacter sp.]